MYSKSLIAAAIAFTTVSAGPLEAQKAQAILWSNADCTGLQSAAIGLHTGDCVPIDNTHSIHFYTDGADEDYGYYSDVNCQDLAFTTHEASVCVQVLNILSFQKLD